MSRLFMILIMSLSVITAVPGLATANAGGQARICMGVNLDFSTDSVTAFNDRLGQPVSAYGRFVPFPLTGPETEGLQTFFDEVGAVGGTAVLSVEPSIPLAQITEAEANNLAQRLALANADGVPVLLRFAPEMNGTWHAWGQQPDAYVAAFRLVADAVHTFAPDTSMLWSPNFGSGYPFGGPTATPVPAALDTNADGTVSGGDDPYAPYYPGDDYVDWVGLTLFYWGNSYPWGENEIPAPDTFVNQVRGGGDSGLPDFYETYVANKGKSFSVFTAALVNPEAPGSADAVAIKQTWWHQVFATTSGEFPELRLVEWLEWTRTEPEAGDAIIDWTLTGDEAVRDAFVADIPTLSILLPDFTAPDAAHKSVCGV